MKNIKLVIRERPAIDLCLVRPVPVRDYELLDNKPQINGVELIGNKTMSEILSGGIILDGRDAEWVAGGNAGVTQNG